MDRCLAIQFAFFHRHLFTVVIDRLISMAMSARRRLLLFIHLILPLIAATKERVRSIQALDVCRFWIDNGIGRQGERERAVEEENDLISFNIHQREAEGEGQQQQQ